MRFYPGRNTYTLTLEHPTSGREVSILFSYAEPVALHIDGLGFIRTAKHWSTTTSRHISAFLGGATALTIQDFAFQEVLTHLETHGVANFVVAAKSLYDNNKQ